MNPKYLITLVGITLIAYGWTEHGWSIVLIWLGINFLILGLAHAFNWTNIFGKKSTGILPFWSIISFFPLLLYTHVLWHLYRFLSKEPAYNTISPSLTVGRRLLSSELTEQFDNYVDLTSEFQEPFSIRNSPSYFWLPILDAGAPRPEIIVEALQKLKSGRTYIHCAQGHGRTGLFAAALLLKFGEAKSSKQALKILQASRPMIRLNKAQLACLKSVEQRISL